MTCTCAEMVVDATLEADLDTAHASPLEADVTALPAEDDRRGFDLAGAWHLRADGRPDRDDEDEDDRSAVDDDDVDDDDDDDADDDDLDDDADDDDDLDDE